MTSVRQIISEARMEVKDNPKIHPSVRAGWLGALTYVEAKLPPVKPHRRLSRANDPESSHEGARRIEPKRGTRKAEVLAVLRAHSGKWVPSEALRTPECGGAEGLRRLRELRGDGWNIGIRYSDDRTKTEYRLIP